METINERIQMIVNKHYRGNESEFARDVGIGQSTLNGILGTRKNNPSADTVSKILNAKRLKINTDWLIKGEGEMERKENTITENAVSREADQTQLKIQMLQERIDQLEAKLEDATRKNAVADYLLKMKDEGKN